MKKVIVAFILIVAIQHLSTAQNAASKKQSSAPKKSLTAKDLNALETESIKALIANEKPKADTVIHTDSFAVKHIETTIFREEKQDSVKTVITIQQHVDTIIVNKIIVADSVVNKVESVNSYDKNKIEVLENKIESKEIAKPKVLTDTLILHQQKIPKLDTVYGVYTKSARLADSIKNAHKHWLDSTLTALPTKKPVVMNADDEVEIFISGGGLYTGVNPTIYNRLTIYNSGLVHKETRTKLQGEKVEDKKISKDALRKLAQYIIDQGFFDFNYLYDCDSKDKDCNTRLKMSPEPTPLSVTVTVGARRKKIYVALYAPHMESNWVNYPANLEKIVNAIYDVVGR